MTETQDTNMTQLDKALQALSAMVVNITDEDRNRAIKELETTSATITRYFKGKGRNLDTAIRLIKFFKARIAEREKLISC